MFSDMGFNFLLLFFLVWIIIGIGSVILVMGNNKKGKAIIRNLKKHLKINRQKHS